MFFALPIEGSPLINKAKGHRATRLDHTCKDEVGLIDDYLLGALKPRVLGVFQQHLAKCPDCAAFLKTYRKTVELTASYHSICSVMTTPLSLKFSGRALNWVVTLMLWLHLLTAGEYLIMQ